MEKSNIHYIYIYMFLKIKEYYINVILVHMKYKNR